MLLHFFVFALKEEADCPVSFEGLKSVVKKFTNIFNMSITRNERFEETAQSPAPQVLPVFVYDFSALQMAHHRRQDVLFQLANSPSPPVIIINYYF